MKDFSWSQIELSLTLSSHEWAIKRQKTHFLLSRKLTFTPEESFVASASAVAQHIRNSPKKENEKLIYDKGTWKSLKNESESLSWM